MEHDGTKETAKAEESLLPQPPPVTEEERLHREIKQAEVELSELIAARDELAAKATTAARRVGLLRNRQSALRTPENEMRARQAVHRRDQETALAKVRRREAFIKAGFTAADFDARAPIDRSLANRRKPRSL